MLSQKLTNTRQYKAFIELAKTAQPSQDLPGTQVMIVLMLMEIVESLDAITDQIAAHE